MCGGLAVDNDGGVYIGGTSSGNYSELTPLNDHSYNYYDPLLIKLDSSGQPLWLTFLGAESDCYAADLTLDSDGNTYLTGNCTSSESDFFYG